MGVRADRARVAEKVVSDLGPLARYDDFRTRMALADMEPYTETGFLGVRERVFPDWKRTKKAAKQDKYVRDVYDSFRSN